MDGPFETEKLTKEILHWWYYGQLQRTNVFFLGDYVALHAQRDLWSLRVWAGIIEKDHITWEHVLDDSNAKHAFVRNATEEGVTEAIEWCRDVRKRMARRTVEQHLQNT